MIFKRLWNWIKMISRPMPYISNYDEPLSEEEKRSQETTTVIACGGGDGAA